MNVELANTFFIVGLVFAFALLGQEISRTVIHFFLSRRVFKVLKKLEGKEEFREMWDKLEQNEKCSQDIVKDISVLFKNEVSQMTIDEVDELDRMIRAKRRSDRQHYQRITAA
jgi:hypothetical protein